MDDDECYLTRGGHFESERASLAMIVAGNMQLFFRCMHCCGFQVWEPLSELLKIAITLLGYTGQGITCETYGATRLVTMPEWQGAGVGFRFLEWVCQYRLDGNGRCGHKYPTFFHTSHPQLCAALRRSKKWIQTNAKLHGDNKVKSIKSMSKAARKSTRKNTISGSGYGGHFRAVQAFKYCGQKGG